MTDMGLQGLESNEMPVCKICGNERPRKHSLGRCLSCYRRELSKRHRQRDRRCPACGQLKVKYECVHGRIHRGWSITQALGLSVHQYEQGELNF
jgi:hypothetical protein